MEAMYQASQSAAPTINRNWIFVATNRDIEQAVIAASSFTNTTEYVAFFEFPAVEYPHTGSTEFGKDGYVSRLNGERSAVKIRNAVARIQPKKIVFLGLTEIEKSYLRGHLPIEICVEVKLFEELQLNPSFAGEIYCKPNEIMRGLVIARYERKKLIIDNSASPLSDRRFAGNRSLAVIEEDNDLHSLAALNLAYSCGQDVILIPPIDRRSLISLPRDLNDWSDNHSHYSYQGWKQIACERMRKVDVHSYKSITFYTTGLPYGSFLSNPVPCSHVVKHLDVGVTIVNALAQEHDSDSFGTALLFSPQLFASEETGKLDQICGNVGLRTKKLLGKEASVENLSNFAEHYPYDIFHICSHGGETDGYFTLQTFVDREGAEHQVEYYEVVGFGPVEGEMVTVHQKVIFHKLDGHKWMSKPLSSFPRYVFEDLMKAIKNENLDAVQRIQYNSPIALSCHIQCHRSIHQGQFDTLSCFGNPIIFNNSCSSSHELAANLLYAGARIYIGTLWKVGTQTAEKAAITFYQSLLRQRNVLVAFHEMLRSVTAPKYQNIYVFWGFHFSTLQASFSPNNRSTIDALMYSWGLWISKASTTDDEFAKKRSIRILKFIARETYQELQQAGVELPPEFDPSYISEIERGLSPRDGINFRNELSEIELDTTQDQSI